MSKIKLVKGSKIVATAKTPEGCIFGLDRQGNIHYMDNGYCHPDCDCDRNRNDCGTWWDSQGIVITAKEAKAIIARMDLLRSTKPDISLVSGQSIEIGPDYIKVGCQDIDYKNAVRIARLSAAMATRKGKSKK